MELSTLENIQLFAFLVAPVILPAWIDLNFSACFMLSLPFSFLPDQPKLDHFNWLLDVFVLFLHIPLMVSLRALGLSEKKDISMKLAFLVKRFLIATFLYNYVKVSRSSAFGAITMTDSRRLQRFKKLWLDMFNNSWTAIGRAEQVNPVLNGYTGSAQHSDLDKFLCCICFLDCEDNHALINCGHFDFCSICVSRLANCPFCWQISA